LSNSLIQKSQIYNLFRDGLYRIFEKKIIKKDLALYNTKDSAADKVLPEEQFYNDLLEIFVADLNQKGVKVIMISVDNQLDSYPGIKAKVSELNSQKLIDYVEVMSWLKNVENYNTPEGHRWGKKAHNIIGGKMAETIKTSYLE